MWSSKKKNQKIWLINVICIRKLEVIIAQKIVKIDLFLTSKYENDFNGKFSYSLPKFEFL